MNRLAVALGAAALCALALSLRVPSGGVGGRLVPGAPKALQMVRGTAQTAGIRFVTLAEMCARSNTVVVGRVEGIVRVDRTPPNSDNRALHSVYRMTVERYLRADGAPHRPAAVNVYLAGGVVNGIGYIMDGVPFLYAGARYLLFMHVFGADIWASYGGVRGFVAFKGEFEPVDIRGVIRLEHGLTAVPNDPYQTFKPWAFEKGGDTLLGLPEQVAIARISQALAGAPYRYEPGEG